MGPWGVWIEPADFLWTHGPINPWTHLEPQPIHQLPRELGAFPLFLVLEVDEGIFPLRLVFADRVGPFVEIRRLVALVAQPEVAVAGRRDHRRLSCVAVGDA